MTRYFLLGLRSTSSNCDNKGSYSNDKSSYYTPKCTPSPFRRLFRRLFLLCSYGRNAVNKLSPLFAGIWANNIIADLFYFFTSCCNPFKFAHVADEIRVAYASPQITPFLIVNSPFTNINANVFICFNAKVSTAYTGMFGQFHSHILSPNIKIHQAIGSKNSSLYLRRPMIRLTTEVKNRRTNIS